CARATLSRRRRRYPERLRRACPRRRRRFQRRRRPASAQRLPASLQPLYLRGGAKIRRQCAWTADDLVTLRLDRKPALPDPMGRRSAKRLGRASREHTRRALLGNERRAVPRDRYRRILWVGAAFARALRPLAAGGRLQLA